MDNWPKGEKIANKDIKLRTFISQESGRAQLVSHDTILLTGLFVQERMPWFVLMIRLFVAPPETKHSTD